MYASAYKFIMIDSLVHVLFIKGLLITLVADMIFFLCIHILPCRRADMKFRHGLCSLKIFNAILLRFSLRLRNSPRPWVRHTQRPASLDALEKPHPKAKSLMSLQPHLNFIRFIISRLAHHPRGSFVFDIVREEEI